MVDQGLPPLVSSLKTRISMYTVDRLKGIIQGFNEHCGSNLNRTGKKSELQEKLKAQLDQWEAANSTVSIANAKKVLDHIDTNGTSAYQLRLYCTSSNFYTAPTAFRPSPVNGPCLMEFPNTCEIRVNNTNLHAQTKGLKKKPGTAPPANLGNSVRTTPGTINKVEMLYCNQNPVQGQPPNNRKYFVQVNLVKATSPDQLVERLRKGKYKPKEEILLKMRQNVDDDDEIEAGPQKLSLKCPLSYTRIEIPIRSSACPHPSCFDASSWYGMMEVTTTWQCPICEKTLNLDEMMVDGYFDDILKTTDEDVEDVIVESNGEWHTQDGKYHSQGWVRPATDPSASRVASTSTSSSATIQSPESKPIIHNGYDKSHFSPVSHIPPRRTSSFHTAAEEIILDSDDDEPGAPVIPSATALRPPLTQERSTGGDGDDVIDLTLSDSEDEAPLAATVGKRKERSPTDGSTAASDSSKRMRYEPPAPGGWREPGGGSSNGNGYRSWGSNGTGGSTPSGYSGSVSGSSSNYGARSASSTYPPPSAPANTLSFLPTVQLPPPGSYGGHSAYNVSPPSNALPSPSINSSSPIVNSPPLPPPPGSYRQDNGGIRLPPLHFNGNSNPRLPALPNGPISPRAFPPPHRPQSWRAPPSPERDTYQRQNERW
ncbi:SUMO ligase siz1 [Tulasnella sp. UAMH 9824]|nr:SUMO ligase siz1 [Tulasnella sp. UAMH 9824]